MPRLLVDLIHPAHFHVFRPTIATLLSRGWSVRVTGREKDVLVQLLQHSGWDYTVVSAAHPGMTARLRELGSRTWRLWREVRAFGPDVVASVGSVAAAFAAALGRRPHVALEDTEQSYEQILLYRYVTPLILTPEGFGRDFGRRQRRYAGFHELAYLHPAHFTPDAAALVRAGIPTDRPLIFVRTVAWQATHDRGLRGGIGDDWAAHLHEWADHAYVVVSAEGPLPPLPAGCVALTDPTIAHHVLAHASLFIGEGGTMATEAAVLGVPAVFVNPLHASNWDELEHRYGLLRHFPDWASALPHIASLLPRLAEVRAECRAGRDALLRDKIDVTAYLVETLTRVAAGGI